MQIEMVEKTFKKGVDNPKKVWYHRRVRKKRGYIPKSKTGGQKMSTYMANPETVTRKWYVIDAANKPLGRTAAAAATILRGKHRPEFTPHVDCGEFVIIVNASKAVLTGKKLDQKVYYRHSGYIGGLKAEGYRHLMGTRPELAMQLAVKGMLPKNKIGDKAITRLKVYAGPEHEQAAQKPTVLD